MCQRTSMLRATVRWTLLDGQCRLTDCYTSTLINTGEIITWS